MRGRSLRCRHGFLNEPTRREPGYPAPVGTTEQILAEAKKAGIKVTVTQRPKGSGEIVVRPGIRPPSEPR